MGDTGGAIIYFPSRKHAVAGEIPCGAFIHSIEELALLTIPRCEDIAFLSLKIHLNVFL